MKKDLTHVNNGSPPHVWGNHRALILRGQARRFTPTRVGKSGDNKEYDFDGTVHPHTCGEIADAPRSAPDNGGSPPHVWGNLRFRLWLFWPWRFTPTRVGKSVKPLTTSDESSVHPHTCGEIWGIPFNLFLAHGSPPHVWGNRMRGRSCRPRARFTPTRVGKSAGSSYRHVCRAVHPHTCGEIREAWVTTGGDARFTPTRVGKSRGGLNCPRIGSVHPHTCGEILTVFTKRSDRCGSPPHVWGNRRQILFKHYVSTVHPHTCGEI